MVGTSAATSWFVERTIVDCSRCRAPAAGAALSCGGRATGPPVAAMLAAANLGAAAAAAAAAAGAARHWPVTVTRWPDRTRAICCGVACTGTRLPSGVCTTSILRGRAGKEEGVGRHGACAGHCGWWRPGGGSGRLRRERRRGLTSSAGCGACSPTWSTSSSSRGTAWRPRLRRGRHTSGRGVTERGGFDACSGQRMLAHRCPTCERGRLRRCGGLQAASAGGPRQRQEEAAERQSCVGCHGDGLEARECETGGAPRAEAGMDVRRSDHRGGGARKNSPPPRFKRFWGA